MLRPQFWWMSGRTACICRMTRWPDFWPLTEARTLSVSLGIWIRKSRTFCESLRFDDIAVCCVRRQNITHTHATASTQFVEANGIRIAHTEEGSRFSNPDPERHRERPGFRKG